MADIEIRLRRPRSTRYVAWAPICYSSVRYIRPVRVVREIETVQEVKPVVEIVPKVTVRRWNEIIPREEIRRWNEVIPREEVVKSYEVRHATHIKPVTTVRTYEEASSTIIESL